MEGFGAAVVLEKEVGLATVVAPAAVAVGADGVRIPPRKTSSITVASRPEEWVPEKTQLIGHNRYRVGTEDAATFGQNYAEILTRDGDVPGGSRAGQWTGDGQADPKFGGLGHYSPNVKLSYNLYHPEPTRSTSGRNIACPTS